MNKFKGICGFKRKCCRKQLVKNNAQRIEISAPVHRSVHPAGLLGRHIGQGTGHIPDFVVGRSFSQGVRRAKVNDLKMPVVRIENNVSGFDVPVNEVGGMDLTQHMCCADGNLQQLFQRKRPDSQQCF